MKRFLEDPDRKVGLILLFLGLVLWFFIIPTQVFGQEQSYFPKILTAWLIVLSVILIVKGYFKKHKVKQNVSKLQNYRSEHIRIIIVTIILIMYVFLIDLLGYFITTILVLLLLMFYLGVRNWKVLLLVVIITVIGFYYFFEVGMKFRFPRGIIF